jgi:aminopeptidase YwaD
MRRLAWLLPAAIALSTHAVAAQEKEDRTLLSWDQMRAIIMEASGERAMHHVLEFVPYQRVRPASEYTVGPFRESRAAADFAKEYGFTADAIASLATSTFAFATT